MPITVAMIEEKEFKTKMRGYDPVEVDEFLDEICDEMVALQDEIATLNQRLSQASRTSAYPQVPSPAMAPAQIPAPISAPAAEKTAEKKTTEQEKSRETSEAAQKLLARAQKVYDETIAEAKEEAAAILKSARTEASVSVETLEERRAALEKEVATLRTAAQDYRNRFLSLISEQQDILNGQTELFE